MDTATFVIALLVVAVFSLAVVIGLVHRDMLAAITRMDRSATAAEHAAQAAREAAIGANRAADACVSLAEQVRDLVMTMARGRPSEPAE
jgi:hypothetical protein